MTGSWFWMNCSSSRLLDIHTTRGHSPEITSCRLRAWRSSGFEPSPLRLQNRGRALQFSLVNCNIPDRWRQTVRCAYTSGWAAAKSLVCSCMTTKKWTAMSASKCSGNIIQPSFIQNHMFKKWQQGNIKTNQSKLNLADREAQWVKTRSLMYIEINPALRGKWKKYVFQANFYKCFLL